jgi:uncharacterized membrane protein
MILVFSSLSIIFLCLFTNVMLPKSEYGGDWKERLFKVLFLSNSWTCLLPSGIRYLTSACIPVKSYFAVLKIEIWIRHNCCSQELMVWWGSWEASVRARVVACEITRWWKALFEHRARTSKSIYMTRMVFRGIWILSLDCEEWKQVDQSEKWADF